MTRVDFAPDRIIFAANGATGDQKRAMFDVAGRETHGYSDPPEASLSLARQTMRRRG